jgi:hypothetical protein
MKYQKFQKLEPEVENQFSTPVNEAEAPISYNVKFHFSN